MSEKCPVYIVYIIALSVLLSVSPYICDKANLPNKVIWDSEEEKKKETSERETDQEEKLQIHLKNFRFQYFFFNSPVSSQ